MELRLHRRVERNVIFILRDEFFFAHATQHIRPTLSGEVGVRDGIVAGGQAESACDQRDLGQREMLTVLPK